MKKIIFFFTFFFFCTSPVFAQDFNSEEACKSAGDGQGFCMSTWISDDDTCQTNWETLGVCTGTINNSACCKVKDNGAVDPEYRGITITDDAAAPVIGQPKCEAPKTSGGWGGICKTFISGTNGCNDSGPAEEDLVGFCNPPGMASDATHCCVAKGTGIKEPDSSKFATVVMTESVCEKAYSADGSGYGGSCEDIDDTSWDPTGGFLDTKDVTCDTPDSVVVGLCRGGLGDSDNGCCVPKTGDYCKKLADDNKGNDVCTNQGVGGTATSIEYSDYQLLEQIPGSSNTSGKLQPYLESLYYAGFVLIVLGAVVMIGFGGFTYMASAGNTSMIKKGKGMITDAIIGLVVALCIWLVLNIINPDLVNLKIDPLPGLDFNTTGLTAENTDTSNTTGSGNQSGAKATNCPSALVPIPNDITLKGGTNMICPELLAELRKLKSVDGWRITRLTGGGAQSQCHKTGTNTTGSCADVAFTNNPGFNSPKWDPLCEAASKLSGVRVLNEASNSTACQKALGPFKKTPNQTGAHLHIDYNGK